MAPPPTPLARLSRALGDRLRQRLLGASIDNLIFRREIGMSVFGRLSPGSPIYWAHGLMAAWLLLGSVAWALWGAWGGVWAFGSVMALLTLGAWPYAMRRAYLGLMKPKSSGAFDEIYLTSISPEVFFEGKRMGLLAPLYEARRYLMAAGLLFCWGILRLFPGPWFLLALVGWLTAINHYGHGAVLGTLAGLKWGLSDAPPLWRMARDWRLNPWPDHLAVLARVGILIGPPVLFLFWISRTTDWPLYPAFALMLFMPLYAAVQLESRERAARERVGATFRLNVDPEAGDARPAASGDPGRTPPTDPVRGAGGRGES